MCGPRCRWIPRWCPGESQWSHRACQISGFRIQKSPYPCLRYDITEGRPPIWRGCIFLTHRAFFWCAVGAPGASAVRVCCSGVKVARLILPPPCVQAQVAISSVLAAPRDSSSPFEHLCAHGQAGANMQLLQAQCYEVRISVVAVQT